MELVFYDEHMFQNISLTYVQHMLDIGGNFTCVDSINVCMEKNDNS